MQVAPSREMLPAGNAQANVRVRRVGSYVQAQLLGVFQGFNWDLKKHTLANMAKRSLFLHVAFLRSNVSSHSPEEIAKE